MKKEEVILEEQRINNAGIEDALQKSLNFNEQYINYLKAKLEEAKKIKEEILNGNNTSS